MFACDKDYDANPDLKMLCPRSYGACEVCGKVTLCYDVPGAWASRAVLRGGPCVMP